MKRRGRERACWSAKLTGQLTNWPVDKSVDRQDGD